MPGKTEVIRRLKIKLSASRKRERAIQPLKTQIVGLINDVAAVSRVRATATLQKRNHRRPPSKRNDLWKLGRSFTRFELATRRCQKENGNKLKRSKAMQPYDHRTTPLQGRKHSQLRSSRAFTLPTRLLRGRARGIHRVLIATTRTAMMRMFIPSADRNSNSSTVRLVSIVMSY